MAESNPELQAKLNELERELEEGDITRKGSVLVPHFNCRFSFARDLFVSVKVSHTDSGPIAMRNDVPCSYHST